jgi:CPA2 family monovalent cation:H+ antiporter-2
MAPQLAEIGVILLMFGVGLQFHFDELLAVRWIAVPGAVGQSAVATALGAVLGWAFGWGWTAGVVFGVAVSVASTVVLIRVLSDSRDLHTRAGHVAVGWLVVEDLFTVVVLVMLPALLGPRDADAAPIAVTLGLTYLKIGALVGFAFLVGGRIIPWLLAHVAALRSRELFTLTVLVMALGIAVGSAALFGVSMALGAFLAGMIVGRSEFSLRAASEALPMRDAFAVLFFVSVGMLFDPWHLLLAPGQIAATLAVILLGKPIAAFVIVYLVGSPPKVGFAVAVALAQIGEFSFMLALLGRELGVMPVAATQTLVAAAIVSITLNPLLYRLVDPFTAWAAQRPKLWAWLNARVKTQLPDESRGDTEVSVDEVTHRAIVIGYGPVGQTVSRLLVDNEIEPTIIDLNVETVRGLRAQRRAAVYGDAMHRDTLVAAGVKQAGHLILAASGLHGSEEIIRAAREINPSIRVYARSAYLRESPALRRAGAERVFSGEGEVALAMTVAILRGLGATPEQIDRERERVQDELFGKSEAAVAEQPSPPVSTPQQV